MKDSDIQRIEHIKTYCEDIVHTVSRFGSDYETFVNDKDYFNSVSMCIMQIGELSTGLSEEFKRQTGDIVPWGRVKSMRNMFAHAYRSMEKDIIWETATRDISGLIKFCDSVMENR